MLIRIKNRGKNNYLKLYYISGKGMSRYFDVFNSKYQTFIKKASLSP